MVFCIKCGTKNDDDIKFCKMCGSRLSNDLNDDGIQKLKKQTLDTIGRAVENDLLVADALDGEPSALKRLITILTQRRDSAGNDNTREMNEIIFAWAERGASKDPSIKTVLSLMYLKGKGTSANVNRGLTLLKEAALGGDADAQFQLGRYYLDGVWFEQSGSEAVRWMTEAAENGHGEALFMLSELYQEGSVVPKDMDRSLDLLIRSADSGYPWAQFKYAKMLKDGKTGTDDRLMIGLFMKACEAGIPEAFYEMAQCYEEGRGVDRSERLFIERMETACGLGVSQAQFRMGKMYDFGECSLQVSKDKADGQYLGAIRKGLKGDVKAYLARNYLWYNNETDDRQKRQQGLTLLKRGCEEGNAQCQGILGWMYSTGNIVPKDDTEAFRLTKLAAEGGYVCGYQLLAEMYEGGKGTDADKEQAKYWAGKCQTTESDQVDGSIKKVKRLFGRKD